MILMSIMRIYRDLASIQINLNYKEHIGRPRKWKRSLTGSRV